MEQQCVGYMIICKQKMYLTVGIKINKPLTNIQLIYALNST